MKKIVVAEGSPTIKSVADSVLRQNGYEVICTSDGLHAWEVITAEKPDLVLTGLGLSGMSGLELCRQMAQNQMTGGVPVVLMVGPKDPVTDEEVLASGARGKLRKPFSPKELLDVVGKLTENNLEDLKTSYNNEPSTDYTKFNAQVSSSRNVKEKSDSIRLDWLDLNNAAPTIKKVVSFDSSSDEQRLIIEDDQYGLAHQHLLNDPEAGMKDKDDYEWFIGEMQRENEKKPSANSPIKPAPAEPIAAQSADDMKFDDIHATADSAESTRMMASIKPQTSSIIEIDAQPSSSSKAYSEEEIARIVDRVVAKLATEIAMSIDKNQIIEAVKAAMKS